VVDTQGGAATTTAFGYDSTGQLTASGADSYAYDAAGNRTGGSYATSAGNEMAADANWTYSYDKEGELTEKDSTSNSASWTYSWSANGLLTAVSQYDSSGTLVEIVDYKYDAFGEEIERDIIPLVGPVTTTKFAVNGWNPATPSGAGNENFSVYAVLTGANALQSQNLFGDKVDEVLGRIDIGSPNKTYWTLTDRQGSVRDVIDNSGAVKDSLAYDGFGNIQAGELDSTYRGWYAYTGRQLDKEIDLQNNHARWYDASTGRWISQDPLGFDAGDSNLYRYVNNAPTDATDPSGEWFWRLDNGEIIATSAKDDTLGGLIDMGYPRAWVSNLAKSEGIELNTKLEFGKRFNVTGALPASVKQVLEYEKSLDPKTPQTDPTRGTGNCYGFVDICLNPNVLKNTKVDPRNYSIVPLQGDPVTGFDNFPLSKQPGKKTIEFPVGEKKEQALVASVKLPDHFTAGRRGVQAKDAQFGDIALFQNPKDKQGYRHVAFVLGRDSLGDVMLLQKLNSQQPYAVLPAKQLKAFGSPEYWQAEQQAPLDAINRPYEMLPGRRYLTPESPLNQYPGRILELRPNVPPPVTWPSQRLI
jgi:RHS repeat-associated protein